MRGIEGANVVRLAVIVPSDDLNEARAKCKNLIPSIIPEQVRRENPVLAIRDFGAEVREEPG